MRTLARYGLVVALAATALSACGDTEEEARQAEVDSIAARRARGETDLSNPEMGMKVLITLTHDSIAQSHTTIPAGQVTFAVQNRDTVPHVFQITGTRGNWRTMAIPPDGAALMAMIIEAGDYDMFCPDTAGGREVCGQPKKISTGK